METKEKNIAVSNWTQHIIDSLDSFRREGHLCDVQIVADDGHAFHAHSAILASASKVFDTCVSQNSAFGSRSLLHTDISSSVLSLVLQFIYTGEVVEELRADVVHVLEGLGVVVTSGDSLQTNDHTGSKETAEPASKPGGTPDIVTAVKLCRADIQDVIAYEQATESSPEQNTEVISKELQPLLGTPSEAMPENTVAEGGMQDDEKGHIVDHDGSGKETSFIHYITPVPECVEHSLEEEKAADKKKAQVKLDPRDEALFKEYIEKYPPRKRGRQRLPKGTQKKGRRTRSANIRPNDGKVDSCCKCVKCDLTFKRKKDLVGHLKTAHKESYIHICSECGKLLRSLPSLVNHMKIHGEPQYECPWCHKQFHFKHGLDRHVETHTGIKKDEGLFVCDECGKDFKTRRSFTMHKTVHGPRKFECEICKKKFKAYHTLKIHLKRCIGKRDYKCEQCSFSGVNKSELKYHLRIHTGEKPFECSICHLTFTRKATMLKHARRKHK